LSFHTLPEQARFLVGDLLRVYASGVEIAVIWDEVNAKLDVLFPIKGRTAEGGGFSLTPISNFNALLATRLKGTSGSCVRTGFARAHSGGDLRRHLLLYRLACGRARAGSWRSWSPWMV
jgi:hypothetical protein